MYNPFQKDDRISADTAISLTESGKNEADSRVSEAPVYRILQALHSHQPQSARAMADEVQMSTDEIKRYLEVLKQRGYIVPNN